MATLSVSGVSGYARGTLDRLRINRHSAVAGTAIWILWQFLAGPSTPAVLMALSPLVLVPLLLGPLLDAAPGSLDDSKLLRGLSFAQLPCALPLTFATSLSPGGLAMLAALPWAAWTAVAAVEGTRRVVARLRAHGPRDLLLGRGAGELAIAGGLGFPIVGSLWLIAHTLGLQPLGFSKLIVILTAAHFHHAGFTLPIMAGYLVRTEPESRVWRVTAAALVLAVPLVAIGITASPLLEVASSWLTAACGLAVGVGMLRRARELPTLPAMLSALAGASLFAAMTFAGSYAVSEFLGTPVPDIRTMVEVHGAVNALGFGLLGAWSWKLTGVGQPAPEAEDADAD